jgi:uncharacterized protein (DUF427 family)
MPTATFQGQTIADSDDTVVVEGNHYFPPAAVNREFLTESAKSTHCPWKGEASYLSVKVGDAEAPDAAWFYPDPKEKAQNIRDHVAFWGDVKVEE